MSLKEIIENVQKLDNQEQCLVIQHLLDSLDNKDEEIERLWVEESERRLEAIKNGQMRTHTFDEVFN